jgi:hypothetical protein
VDSTPGLEGAWETFATDYGLSDVAQIISREHLSTFSTLASILGLYCRSARCPHCGESQTFLWRHRSRGTRGKGPRFLHMSRLIALIHCHYPLFELCAARGPEIRDGDCELLEEEWQGWYPCAPQCNGGLSSTTGEALRHIQPKT